MDLLHLYSYNENKYYNIEKMCFFWRKLEWTFTMEMSRRRIESRRKVNG